MGRIKYGQYIAFFLLGALVLAAVLTGCGKSTVTYTNSEYGFSFDHPSDWKLEEENSQEEGYTRATYMTFEGKGYGGSLFVNVFDKEMTLEKAAESSAAAITDPLGLTKVSNLKRSATTLGGEPAVLFTYDSTDDMGDIKKESKLVTVKNGKEYDLDYSIDEKDYSADSDPFKELVESFEFTK